MINALRYPGGKLKHIKHLTEYIPDNICEFREPLCGGLNLSLFYGMGFNYIFKASDLNYELYCFWKYLKSNPNELITILKYIKNTTTNGKALYDKIINRRQSKLSEFERAIDFFVINRISFSGLADSGGYSNESFEKRFTLSSIDKLNMISNILKKFEIYCDDYSYLFELPGDNVFIYADPPYYTQTNSRLYGKSGDLHIGFDHDRFGEFVKKCKHNVLITYDDCEYTRSMYKDFNIYPLELQYSMNNVNSDKCKKGKELIITNYRIK